MKEMILAKYGELILKGQNRHAFENILRQNLRRRLAPAGRFGITTRQSTVYIQPLEDPSGDAPPADMDRAVEAVSRVFGLSAFSRCTVCEKDMNAIAHTVRTYLKPRLEQAHTFRVTARRSDKAFPLTSPEICTEIGRVVLEAFPHLKVNLQNPDETVTVEVREQGAYIYGAPLPGAGGMPVGSNGRAALMISGGIDSPVAGYMIAKRGIELIGVHFHSYPYTSERALDKVVSLMEQLYAYAGRMYLHVVPFTEIQTQIHTHCPEDYYTLIMRRSMVRITEQIALSQGCDAMVTGESVGQVASQTIKAIGVTDSAAGQLPIFRPCIGMDKEEIIRLARKIGTFETSILPYEDCCSVFTPRHPRTRPQLEDVVAAEKLFDYVRLEEKAVAGTEKRRIG